MSKISDHDSWIIEEWGNRILQHSDSNVRRKNIIIVYQIAHNTTALRLIVSLYNCYRHTYKHDGDFKIVALKYYERGPEDVHFPLPRI